MYPLRNSGFSTRSLDAAKNIEDRWYGREISTSMTTALLIQGSRDDWPSERYEQVSQALEYADPLGCLIWERLAERRRRIWS